MIGLREAAYAPLGHLQACPLVRNARSMRFTMRSRRRGFPGSFFASATSAGPSASASVTSTSVEWEARFARFEPLLCNLSKPIALRYHGHQFDVYNPNLGDGRGFLFAQLRRAGNGAPARPRHEGQRHDAMVARRRRRLTLKGGVREVLATEMLEALGVTTSKSMSLFETGEALVRGDEPSPTRSSVLVRLGHSHIRFGSSSGSRPKATSRGSNVCSSYAIAHYYPAARRGEPTACPISCGGHPRDRRRYGRHHGRRLRPRRTQLRQHEHHRRGFDYGPYRFLPPTTSISSPPTSTIRGSTPTASSRGPSS